MCQACSAYPKDSYNNQQRAHDADRYAITISKIQGLVHMNETGLSSKLSA